MAKQEDFEVVEITFLIPKGDELNVDALAGHRAVLFTWNRGVPSKKDWELAKKLGLVKED